MMCRYTLLSWLPVSRLFAVYHARRSYQFFRCFLFVLWEASSCFPPLCSVPCASQPPVFFFLLLLFFRLFNFPACHSFQLFPAKTVGVGISLTVNGIKLLYTFFFFRVMQGVAWFISVLVIGINMFFVAEYVVSCAPVCHSPPSSPHEHTKYRLYVQTSAEARPNLFSSWNPCSFSLADIPEKNRWIRALTCNDLFNLDIDAKYWKASYDIISELDSFANYFQANTENTEMVYYQHLRRLLPVLFYTPN